jgi:hypothetical protein
MRSGRNFTELEGKTVGIIGIGFIGSEIARKLKYGFRCRVLGYDPYADQRLARLADVEMMESLADMLGLSQILVLVPELTKETRNLIATMNWRRCQKVQSWSTQGGGRCLTSLHWIANIFLQPALMWSFLSRCRTAIPCSQIPK